MGERVIESFRMTLLSASGNIKAGRTKLAGFYVNSTTGGTLILKDGGSGGTAKSGTITPGIGFHAFPGEFADTAYATISGTISITFFYE